MPKRTESHRIADAATNRVIDVFTRLGCACETVKQDYGEDVLVHPAFGDDVQNYHIWIQVKGTGAIDRLRAADGTYRWPVSVGHALRWIRSREPVIVILWDVANEVGYHSSPKNNLGDWSLMMARQATTNIVFRETDKFDDKTAQRLLWVAWLDHYETLIVQALKGNEIRKHLGEPAGKSEGDRVLLLGFEVLKHLGIIRDDASFDPHFLEWFKNATINIRRDNKKRRRRTPAGEPPATQLAAALALACQIEKVAGTGVGVPLHILEVVPAVARRLMKHAPMPRPARRKTQASTGRTARSKRKRK